MHGFDATIRRYTIQMGYLQRAINTFEATDMDMASTLSDTYNLLSEIIKKLEAERAKK
jgi:hypothetical protein